MTATEPKSLFGQWEMCTDGSAHYRLGALRLCGTTSVPTGAPLPKRKNTARVVDVRNFCLRCRKVNFLRWLGGSAQKEATL